jgi:hypothetical protein
MMPDGSPEDFAREHGRIIDGPNPYSNRSYGPDQGGKARRRRTRRFRGFLSSAAFLALMQPPDYLVDGILLTGSTYTLTGKTGHGKTLVALLLAIRVACGDWFCGRKCKQGTAAFFAGENPDNVMMQFYSICRDLSVDAATLPIIWHRGVFDIEEALEIARRELTLHRDLSLCIFDSLQAFFQGDDDSQNMQMLNAAVNFRAMSEGHANRPAGLILAHPVKNAARDNLLPRGGSSVTNELDGNLTCWLDEEKRVVTLHWHGKFRGVPFDPVKLEMVVVKPEGLVDANGLQMPCTIVRPLLDTREAELAQQSDSREMAILSAIKATPGITQGDLASLVGVSRSTVQREITALKKRKWLRDYSGVYKLTTDGNTALELRAK